MSKKQKKNNEQLFITDLLNCTKKTKLQLKQNKKQFF